MRMRSGKDNLEPLDLELERTRRKIRSERLAMADDNRAELEMLQEQVKLLMDEKLTREEQEKINREILFPRVLVLMLIILSCAYPLFKGLSSILLQVGPQKMQTATSRGSWRLPARSS